MSRTGSGQSRIRLGTGFSLPTLELSIRRSHSLTHAKTRLSPIEIVVQVRLPGPFVSWMCGTNDNVTAVH